MAPFFIVMPLYVKHELHCKPQFTQKRSSVHINAFQDGRSKWFHPKKNFSVNK
jgi:hypothetical protein